MAAIPDTDRAEVWRDVMKQTQGAVSCLKDDVRAAVDATDAWLDENWSSFNQSLPDAYRTTANRKQKARMLLAVIERRFKVEA